jgi:putative ABC transport system substrate-binding protein
VTSSFSSESSSGPELPSDRQRSAGARPWPGRRRSRFRSLASVRSRLDGLPFGCAQQVARVGQAAIEVATTSDGRRRFLAGLSALLVAPHAVAQRSNAILVVGALYPNRSTTSFKGKQVKVAETFFARWLNELGWKVGKEVRIEDASAEGDNTRLPALAAELVSKNVDVIWVAGPEAAIAAARATTTIPIAFYGVAWPADQGFVDSLARPGRNITGLAAYAGDEEAKRLELLREIVPGATRVAFLFSGTAVPTLSGKKLDHRRHVLEAAAAKLGFELRRYEVAGPEDFKPAFNAVLADRTQVLSVPFSALIFRERMRLAEFALRNRLPSAHGGLPPVEAGGLIYRGASRDWMVKYSWTYVDRILRGANPATLAVELPSKFEVVVNLKTAKALGITIPQSVLLRADRLIE